MDKLYTALYTPFYLRSCHIFGILTSGDDYRKLQLFLKFSVFLVAIGLFSVLLPVQRQLGQ